MNRYGTTNEASSATLRNYSELALVAVAHDSTNISCVLRLEHDLGSALVLVSPVSVMNVEDFFVCDNSSISDHSFEELYVLSQ